MYGTCDYQLQLVDGFLQGYGWNGRRHRPATDLVSLYVDQHPAGDQSVDRARMYWWA